MPKIVGTVGTGVTRRATVSFDWDVPGDADLQVQAAIEAHRRMSFELTSTHLGNLAQAILVSADLPCDPNQLYRLIESEGWAALESDNDPEGLLLSELVLALGREPDSPEGYAAKILSVLLALRNNVQAGNVNGALALAFFAGGLASEAGFKAVYEDDALPAKRSERADELLTSEHTAPRRTGPQGIKSSPGHFWSFEQRAKRR